MAKKECEKVIDPCEQNRLELVDSNSYEKTYELGTGIKEIAIE